MKHCCELALFILCSNVVKYRNFISTSINNGHRAVSARMLQSQDIFCTPLSQTFTELKV